MTSTPNGSDGGEQAGAGGGGGGIGRMRVNSAVAAGLGGTVSPPASTGQLSSLAPPIVAN